MKVKRYGVRFSGTAPLLMNNQPIPWLDKVFLWRESHQKDNPFPVDPKLPRFKQLHSGDDRFPLWSWIGKIHHNEVNISISDDIVLSTLRRGGARIPKEKGSYKSAVVSTIVVDQKYWELKVNENKIPIKPIFDLVEIPNIDIHKQTVERLGFSLFERIYNDRMSFIPRFDNWSCEGSVTVVDADNITEKIFQEVVTQAGLSGIGAWRPESPKSPGPFGTFNAKMIELKI